MPQYLDSQIRRYRRMRGSCCAACGEAEYGKLCIDHDRWKRMRNGNYPGRVLCLRCNLRKGAKRYVPFPDGTMWLPGKPVGWRTPNTNRADVAVVKRLIAESKASAPAEQQRAS